MKQRGGGILICSRHKHRWGTVDSFQYSILSNTRPGLTKRKDLFDAAKPTYVFDAVLAETVTVTKTTRRDIDGVVVVVFSLNDANGLQLGQPIGR
jgi:hypothetical protein